MSYAMKYLNTVVQSPRNQENQMKSEQTEFRSKRSVPVWTNRFLMTTMIHVIFAICWTSLFVLTFIKPPLAMIMSYGSAGTWLLAGYVLYIVAGPLGNGLNAVLYQYFEVDLEKKYTGFVKIFAWLHLILGNIGTAGATWLLMIAGYFGGRALMPTSLGGLGMNELQTHITYMSHFIVPIGIFTLITIIGYLFGVLGYIREEEEVVTGK